MEMVEMGTQLAMQREEGMAAMVELAEMVSRLADGAAMGGGVDAGVAEREHPEEVAVTAVTGEP